MLSVPVGTAVTFTNTGSIRTVTATTLESFDVRLEPGESFTVTLARTGRINLICRIHGWMTAVIEVVP